MGMISDSDVSQFDQLGYFITDVVIERDRLLAVRQEFDRLYHEGIEEAKSSGNLDNVTAKSCLLSWSISIGLARPLAKAINFPVGC